ncbi:MAG: hypothetical protein KDC48_05875 [Planctomycetes bacterium]|nr:hypothetical protein [Planctomycetota bacterium]
MMHEVRSIPPAPRKARLSALLAHRWPILAIGGALTVLGALLAWLMFLQAGGKPSEQLRLDAGPVDLATATVVGVDKAMTLDGRRWQMVHYVIEHPDGAAPGSSIAPAGRYAVQDSVQVEMLVGEENINRIVGTLRHVMQPWCQPERWLVTMVVPGLLVLLGWLAGAFQLRQVIVHGDVSVGRLLAIRPVAHVLPEMLDVVYSFRDHRAVLRHGRHWVRRHGELGQRLEQILADDADEPLPVLHDRRLPQWNRLLLPDDFLAAPTANNRLSTPHA